LVLLDLNGLEEVTKYSFFSPSSLLVVKLISVERRVEGFSLPLFTACRIFRLQLPFKCINLQKGRPKTSFRVQLWLQSKPFLLFKFGDCSAISLVVVVLVTIVSPNIGPLMIHRLVYNTGKSYSFLIIFW
jgi:hypothetical protein